MKTKKNSDHINIDRCLKCLNKADILEGKKNLGYRKLHAQYCKIQKFYRKTLRLRNVIFNDGVWYNESKASEFLKRYTTDEKFKQEDQSDHIKIKQLYHRLAHLKKGKGTWANGINPDELKKNDSENDATDKTDTKHPPPPAGRSEEKASVSSLVDDIFVSELDDEETFKEKKSPKVFTEDPNGKKYRFEFQKNQRSPSSSILFHIHGDEFGHGSELEGGNQTQMVNYLTNYLTNARPIGCPTKLLEELRNTLSIKCNNGNTNIETEKVVRMAQAKIKNCLHTSSPLLIEGGWIGNPSGHAIYYEILPGKNSKASFRLYNTGGGADYHASSYDGHKLKYKAFEEWNGIKHENLTSPDFIEALYELNSYRNIPGNSLNTDYSEEDVYVHLRDLLDPTEASTNCDESSELKYLMSPQQAGICSWRSLMAFMRTKMEINDYKRLICDLKLQSLQDYINQTPQECTKNWRLVKKSHQKLCRSILKLHKQKIIGEDYLKSVKNELFLMDEWIRRNSDNRYRDLSSPDTSEYRESIRSKHKTIPNIVSQTLEEKRSANNATMSGSQPLKNTLDFLRNIKTNNPLEVQKSLSDLISKVNEDYNDTDRLSIHKGIIDFVTKLEMDKGFWEQAVKDDLHENSEKIICDLGKIVQLFMKTCFDVPDAEIIFSEKIYTFKKLLHIQQILCDVKHPGKYDLWIHSYDLCETSPFVCFPNAKMQRDMIRIESSRVGKTYDGATYDSVRLILNFDKYCNKTPFRNFLEKEFPQVLKAIAQENINFNSLPSYSQSAHLFASPLLPDWMKAKRDAELAFLRIAHQTVSSYHSANESPSFRITDYVNSTTIKVTNSSGYDFGYDKLPAETKIYHKGTHCNNYRLGGWVKRLYFGDQYPVMKSKEILKIIPSEACNEQSEKSLSIIHAKHLNLGMPDEDFHELSRLFINEELKLIETLEYFTKYPEKFHDSDYQTLFHILLFSTGGLDKNLSTKDFENLLSRFVQQNYELFHEENAIETAVFFLKVAHQLRGFCPDQPFYNNTTETLTKLLNRNDLEKEDKALIYGELIAQLGHKETLSLEEIKNLIVGSVLIKENQQNSRYATNPFTQKECREAFLVHATQIQKALEEGQPNQELLNQIIKELRPQVTESKKWVLNSPSTSEFPHFVTTDNTHSLFPLLSILLSSHSTCLLPVNINQNADFQKLFPNVKEASFNPGNVYSFNDAQGHLTLVSLIDDKLIIDQKRNDRWMRFIPSDTFLYKDKNDLLFSYLGSQYLVHNFSHWKLLKENKKDRCTIYLINSKTDQPQYLLTARFTFQSSRDGIPQDIYAIKIRTFSTNLELKIPDNSHWASFEDLSNIHHWYDNNNNLKRVDLPRHKLSFVQNNEDPNIYDCEEFPGYSLNIKAPVKKLGIHFHYFLLENNKQQNKVLLPKQKLVPSMKPEVLTPAYDVNYSVDTPQTIPQDYYVFDIDEEGKLFNKSREANLFLAKILAAGQKYTQAAAYLKIHGSKLRRFTNEEETILDELASIDQITRDESGNGTSLQLYSHYLVLKNKNSFHQKVSNDDFSLLLKLYERYIDKYHNATALKLQDEEETFILKLLLQQNPDSPICLNRLNELTNIEHKASSPTKKSKENSNTTKTLEGFKVPEVFKGKSQPNKPTNHVLISRPQHAMTNHFLFFYEVARTGSIKEKNRLKASLPFLRSGKKGANQGMANFFEVLLENPTDFPAPLDEEYNPKNRNTGQPCIDSEGKVHSNPRLPCIDREGKEIAKWIKTVTSNAEKKLRKLSKNTDILKPSSDSSFDNFNLLPAQAKRDPVSIQISLPSLSDFSNVSSPYFTNKAQDSIGDTNEGLSSLIEASRNHDPVHNQEVTRLQEDLNAFNTQPQPPIYTLDGMHVEEIKNLLLNDQEGDQKELAILKNDILLIANKGFPEGSSQNDIAMLSKWGKIRKSINLDELIIAFARNDFGQILDKNPALEKPDLQPLGGKIGSYLLYATREQQRKRSKKVLQELEGCEIRNYDDVAHRLAEELLASKKYIPNQYPAYLAFEYFANITMRETQVHKLEQFLEEENPNLVMEMIMGSGKSKVLLPLLGLLRADGNTLSMLIVPQPLFESVSDDTQKSLSSFSQELKSLHFDRQTKFTKTNLENIYDDLTHIRKNKECLIMTSKSVQCLILKFVEESSAHINKNDGNFVFTDELRLMQKILLLLKQSGYPIIDEADTVLNVLHEVSFSSGRSLFPQLSELELLSEIYSILYENPSINTLAQLESDPNPDNEAQIITEQLYFEKIQDLLAQELIKRLGEMTFESGELTNKLHLYVATLEKPKRELLVAYLCRDKQLIEKSQEYFDSLDSEIQNIIAFAGEEISHLLPYTLTRNCEEKYGLDPKSNSPLAIPYSASKTPNSGSQFSNPHITMNYTFQTYMKNGISFEMVEQQIQLLQGKALHELKTSEKVSVMETPSGKTFSKLRDEIDIPFFNYKPKQLKILADSINQSSKSKRNFVTSIILPQLEQFEYKMSCNPQNLVDFFSKAAGFTGTLWNGTSMHHKLAPEPEKGTDAKTLSILWNKSKNNAIKIKLGSFDEMLSEIKEQDVVFDMISDAGGYFKEGANSAMAHKIAKTHGKEVVFYNHLGEQTITDGSNEMHLSHSHKSPEERLTFLDQSHTTGADVQQKLDAVSIVTIGRNMILRDLLQSVWRLRGLHKSQSVRFIINDEVAGIIRQKLDLTDDDIQLKEILKFVITNQAAQQGRDNYKALKEGFANVMQKILLDVLLHERIKPDIRHEAFSELHSLWISPALFSPRELYGTLTSEKDGKEVLKLETRKCKESIEKLFDTQIPWLPELGITKSQCLDEIDLIVKKVENNLPEMLQVPAKEIEDDQTVEVEQELKTETERETELEVEDDNLSDISKISEITGSQFSETLSFSSAIRALKYYKSRSSNDYQDRLIISYHGSKNHSFALSSYLKEDKKLKPYADVFSDINITTNVIEFADNPEKEHELLGTHRIDFHHLLINENGKVTLLTQNEASSVLSSSDYYNLTLGFNDQTKTPPNRAILSIIKLKFLNGESHYTSEEIKLLERWLKNPHWDDLVTTKDLHTLFTEHILHGRPQKAARYQGSPLQKLFFKYKDN